MQYVGTRYTTIKDKQGIPTLLGTAEYVSSRVSNQGGSASAYFGNAGTPQALRSGGNCVPRARALLNAHTLA
jgi:hypothetical protein